MKRTSKKELSVISAGGVGAASAIILSLVFVFILSSCVLKEMFSLDTATVLVPVFQCLCAIAGSLAAGLLTKENKIMAIGVVLGIYIITLLCGALLFFNGISGSVLTGLLVIAAGGLLALMLLSKRTKPKSQKGRRLHRNR